METAVPVIVGVLGAASSVYAATQHSSAADDARDIARRNARREEQEAEEAARRKIKENRRTEATARARAAASGFDIDSESTQLYLDELRRTGEEEVEWLLRSGASRADITRSEGDLVADESIADMWTSFGRAAGYAVTAGGAAYDWATAD